MTKEKEAPERVNVNFLLEPDKKRQLKRKAVDRDLTLSELLRKIIDKLLDENCGGRG